jgi:hypothetical protein
LLPFLLPSSLLSFLIRHTPPRQPANRYRGPLTRILQARTKKTFHSRLGSLEDR